MHADTHAQTHTHNAVIALQKEQDAQSRQAPTYYAIARFPQGVLSKYVASVFWWGLQTMFGLYRPAVKF